MLFVFKVCVCCCVPTVEHGPQPCRVCDLTQNFSGGFLPALRGMPSGSDSTPGGRGGWSRRR